MTSNILEVHKIDTKEKYTEPFKKILVSNLSHRFDHVYTMNGEEQSSISYDLMWGEQLLFGLYYDFAYTSNSYI